MLDKNEGRKGQEGLVEKETEVVFLRDDKETHGEGQDRERSIKVEVNNKPITLTEKELTGREIKAAAIAQGVKIDEDFVLSVEKARGDTRVVQDDELVKVHNNMSFVAVAPDDNS